MRRLKLTSSIENVWSGARLLRMDRVFVSCASREYAYTASSSAIWIRREAMPCISTCGKHQHLHRGGAMRCVSTYGEYQRLLCRNAERCASEYGEYQRLLCKDVMRCDAVRGEYQCLLCKDAAHCASVRGNRKPADRPAGNAARNSRPTVRLVAIACLLAMASIWNTGWAATVKINAAPLSSLPEYRI